MFTIKTDEEPKKLKNILTDYGVLDKDGNVIDGFSEMLEKELKEDSK